MRSLSFHKNRCATLIWNTFLCALMLFNAQYFRFYLQFGLHIFPLFIYTLVCRCVFWWLTCFGMHLNYRHSETKTTNVLWLICIFFPLSTKTTKNSQNNLHLLYCYCCLLLKNCLIFHAKIAQIIFTFVLANSSKRRMQKKRTTTTNITHNCKT